MLTSSITNENMEFHELKINGAGISNYFDTIIITATPKHELDFKYENLSWGSLKPTKITEKEKIKPVFLRLDSEFATDKKKGK